MAPEQAAPGKSFGAMQGAEQPKGRKKSHWCHTTYSHTETTITRRVMISVHDMHSPIDSPFMSDFGTNYGTDSLTSHQSSHFERRLVLHYVIAQSLQLILQSYAEKFSWQSEEIELALSFTTTLTKRSAMTLEDFQRSCIVFTRYLEHTATLEIPLKQVILGVVVAVQGLELKPWDMITGMPLNSVVYLNRYLDFDDYDLHVHESELTMINEKMKRLIYARFDVV